MHTMLCRYWSDQILKEALNRVFKAQISANTAHFARVIIGSKVTVWGSGSQSLSDRGPVNSFFCKTRARYRAAARRLRNTGIGSRDSSVGIVKATGWTARFQFLVGVRVFSAPQRPDRLWSPPSLLSKRHRG
jgi:hypothetical protein